MGASGGRLTVFAVLLATLVAVLLGRTVQLQTTGAAAIAQAAQGNSSRTLQDPPARGLILDQAGRPLAANHQQMQIVADRNVLYDMPGDGAEVLNRVAVLLGTTFEELDARLTLCESPAAVREKCWAGAVGEPIPLSRGATMDQALPVLEQADQFPGISVHTVTTRTYPATAGERAGHLVGHLGAVTQDEVAAKGLDPLDDVGRGGLEQQYDDELRGTPGTRTVLVDNAGRVTHTLQSTPAVNGATVVTSIDASLQAVVEQQLAAAVERARATSGSLAADSGAAVVVDVTNGQVLAMASYPDYSPTVWTGGISEADYRSLADSGALLFNPIQGTYAPGSTYKVFTVAGMAAAGYDLNGSYPAR